MKTIIIIGLLSLSGCTYNLDQKNLVDQSAEWMCRTEFEFQKIVGNNDCKLMNSWGCKIIIENYLPKASCVTPDNEVKDFFESDYKEEEKHEQEISR